MNTPVLTLSLAALFAASLQAATTADFTRHLEITVSGAATNTVDVPVEGVPVLVRLSTAIQGFSYSDLNSDGTDLMFALDDGTPLPHEMDTWNPAGTSLVWVRIPSLAKGMTFHAYYRGVTPEDTSGDVWQDYAGVWHLNEQGAGGTSYDSTTNHYNGVNEATTTSIAGKISGGREISKVGSGTKGSIVLAGTADLELGDSFTVSAWIKIVRNTESLPNSALAARRDNPAAKNGEGGFYTGFYNNSSSPYYVLVGGAGDGNKNKITSPDVRNNWRCWHAVYDGTTTGRLYLDGVSKWTPTVQPPVDNGMPVVLGNDTNGDAPFPGQMDEVRIRKVASTPEFIKEEYNAMNSSSYLVYGAVEEQVSSAIAFSGASVVRNLDGTFTVTADVADGSGDIYFILDGTTNLMASAVTAPAMVTYTAAVVADRSIDYKILGVSGSGSESVFSATETLLSGDVSVVGYVHEAAETLPYNTFRFSRPAANPALDEPVEIAYSVSGTALGGTHYAETLSGVVVIPSGEMSTVLSLTPVAGSLPVPAPTVTLTILPGPYGIAAPGAATVALVVPPTVSWSNSPAVPLSGEAVTFTALPEHFLQSPIDYRWDFDSDGVIDAETTDPTYVRSFDVAGVYTVTVYAQSGELFAPVSWTTNLLVASHTMYVSAGNPAAAFPYDTPETAAPDIKEAVSNASDGTTIFVADGLYPISGPIVLEKDIRVIGNAQYPSAVVVSNTATLDGIANNPAKDIFEIDSPDALVSGLTMVMGTRHKSNQLFGASATIGQNGGTISNCVIRSGRGVNSSTPTAGVLLFNGLVTHTLVEGGYCDHYGDILRGASKGAAFKLNGRNARVSNCLIQNVNPQRAHIVAVDQGVFENCTIHHGSINENDAAKITEASMVQAVYASANATVRNIVVADVRRSYPVTEEHEVVNEVEREVLIDDVPILVTETVTNLETIVVGATDEAVSYTGAAASYIACASDCAEPVNGACYVGPVASLFKNAANDDLRPGDLLLNRGVMPDGMQVPALDFGGGVRLIGTRIDIGCYEGLPAHTLLLLR